MEQILVTVLPLILSNNLVMSLIKWISPYESNLWLRSVLFVVSILGVIATAAATGNPVDFNSIHDLSVLLAEAIATAVASHFSYKAIKNA